MVVNILETRELEYRYPDGTPALRGVSVALGKRGKVAFLGANGAGKTTLFLNLMGILRPTRGKVLFRGRALKYDSASLLSLRRSVGMVFQNPDDQLFAPTVAQDVSFGPRNLGLGEDEVEARVRRALKIAGVEELADKPPHLLSYGQKKRVAIAGVLALEPEVLILDEPLAGLDPAGKRRFIEFLEELAENKAVVVATHDVDFAYGWADYVYVLHRGRIVAEGEPKQIFGTAQAGDLPPPRLLEFYEALSQLGLAMPRRRPDSLLELVRSVASLGVRMAAAECPLRAGEGVSLHVERGRVLAKPCKEGGASGKVIRVLEEGVVVSANGGIAAGTIYIYPLEKLSGDAFEEVLLKHEVELVAPLGSEAWLLAERHGVTPAVNSNLEACLLKALAGYNALLLVKKHKIGEVIEEVRRLSSHLRVRVEVLGDGDGT
jgi:cobalt/nickel transport system ATP-binding protein